MIYRVCSVRVHVIVSMILYVYLNTHCSCHTFSPMRLCIDYGMGREYNEGNLVMFFLCVFQLDPQTVQSKNWHMDVIEMNGVSDILGTFGTSFQD